VTLGGKAPADGRKVKGIIHWVSAAECLNVEVRLYGRLFGVRDPEVVPVGQDFKANLNKDSLSVFKNAKIEKTLDVKDLNTRYQFERVGYFCQDHKDSRDKQLVFNMVVDLKDGRT
jgi:glutaminyl-tRNA synthetase